MREEYAIYLRKSRKDREAEKQGQGETLARHKRILLDLAQKYDYKIGKIYKEIVSGESIAERTEMQSLLKDVEAKKWKGVLVIDIDRLTRGDSSDQGVITNAFKYSATLIITPVKTFDFCNDSDEENIEFSLFLSRREYKIIKKRIQRGRFFSVTEGKYVGSVPPFGYQRKKLEKAKGWSLIPNPTEAGIVKKIFKLYSSESISINQVAKELNALGLKPRKAEQWTISSVKDILNNPVYIGKIRWNARKQVINSKNGQKIVSRPRNNKYILVDGLHKPLIDQKLWDIVQAKRSCNTPPVQHNNIVKNPLAGLVFCEKCGKPMQRRPYNLKKKPATLMCSNPNCDNISSKLYIVESQVLKGIDVWIKNYKLNFKEEKINCIKEEQRTQKILGAKLNKENEKLNKIFEFVEDGTYTKEEFAKRSSVIKENIAKIQEKIQEIEKFIQIKQEAEKNRKVVIPKLERVIDLYNTLKTEEEKNLLLKSVIEKATYLKLEKAIKKDSDPTNFELHIYPKIPKIC